MLPLEGIVMLDLTHMLSGPYGTMLLTDLGVETIKVEPPMREKAPANCSQPARTIPGRAWAPIS